MKIIIPICISIFLCSTAFADQVELRINGLNIEDVSNENQEPLKSMPGEKFAEMLGVTYESNESTSENSEDLALGKDVIFIKRCSTSETIKSTSSSFATISTWWQIHSMVQAYAWCDVNLQTSGDFEYWFVKIMLDGTPYYYKWGEGWQTQVTPLYQELDPSAPVGHYYMAVLVTDLMLSGADYYYGVDDNPNGIFDGTLVYDLIDY